MEAIYIKHTAEDELYHHGVLGMHWGVRRYQNTDGSLTPAGKAKYGKKVARKYYRINRLQRKAEKTESFKDYRKIQKKIRKTSTRMDRASHMVSKSDIEAGKAKIATFRRNRNITIAAAAPLISAGAIAVAGPLGLATIPAAAVATGKSVYKLPYWSREARFNKKTKVKLRDTSF